MDTVVFEQSSGGEHTSVFEAVVQEAGISALLEVVGDRILRVRVGQRNPSLILIGGQDLRVPRQNSSSELPC